MTAFAIEFTEPGVAWILKFANRDARHGYLTDAPYREFALLKEPTPYMLDVLDEHWMSCTFTAMVAKEIQVLIEYKRVPLSGI